MGYCFHPPCGYGRPRPSRNGQHPPLLSTCSTADRPYSDASTDRWRWSTACAGSFSHTPHSYFVFASTRPGDLDDELKYPPATHRLRPSSPAPQPGSSKLPRATGRKGPKAAWPACPLRLRTRTLNEGQGILSREFLSCQSTAQ